MLSLDNPRSRFLKRTKVHWPSLLTANTSVNGNKAATSMWAMLLSSKGVQDGNNGMYPKMEQTETALVAELDREVNNVVPSKIKMEEMITAKIGCTIERRVAKETYALLPDSIEGILWGAYNNAWTWVFPPYITSLNRSYESIMKERDWWDSWEVRLYLFLLWKYCQLNFRKLLSTNSFTSQSLLSSSADPAKAVAAQSSDQNRGKDGRTHTKRGSKRRHLKVSINA